MANPEDAALDNRLGICYQRMGDAKAARKAYKKAIDLRSDYAEVWNNIGTLDHARSRYKQAISAYSKAIRLDPEERRLLQEPRRGVARAPGGAQGARGLERGVPARPRDLREQRHRGGGLPDLPAPVLSLREAPCGTR